MRTVQIGGILLLLLILAALVALRRSRDAVARPASISEPARASPAADAAGGASAQPAVPSEHPPPVALAGLGTADGESETGDGGLILEPSEVDLGGVEAGEQRRVEVRWKRTGVGAVRIRSIYTG